MKRKKILIVGKSPPPYFGTTVWFKTLEETKWSTEFEMLWFNNNIHKSLNTIGSVGARKFFLNIKLYLSFYQTILKHKPDLVLIPVSQTTLGFVKDSVFVRIANRYSRTLLMLHGANWLNWLKSSDRITNRYVRNTLKGAKGVVVLGKKIKKLFETFFPDESIYVVPNGISASNPQQFFKEDAGLFKITYLGNLMPAKGIKEIIESLIYLKDKKIELKVIGQWMDDHTKEYCESLIAINHLPVIFKGALYDEDKLSELNNSDLFVFTPNKPEGHPLVIIEALAAGLPIISTDQGAITESVIDGLNGFIVGPNNAKQISEKIKFLMENPETLLKMGIESRKLYEEKFTAEKMVKNFEQVFRAVLQ